MYRVDLIPPDWKPDNKVQKNKNYTFRVKKSQNVGDSNRDKKGNKHALLKKQQLLDFKEILEESIDLLDEDSYVSYSQSEETTANSFESIHGDTYEKRRRDNDYINPLNPSYGPKK